MQALESGSSRRRDVFSGAALDALSYIDPLSDREKQKALALIDEEMKRSTKRPAEYLREMGPLPALSFPDHPVLHNEFVRIQERRQSAPMDKSRFDLPEPPLTRRHDPAAWRDAANNAAAQLGHQQLKILNLELALKHAPDAWRAHNLRTAAVIKQLEGRADAAEAAIVEVNKRRKLRQEAAAPELARLGAEYGELTSKNVAIEVACQRLQAEAARLEEALSGGTAAAADAPAGAQAAGGGGEGRGDGAFQPGGGAGAAGRDEATAQSEAGGDGGGAMDEGGDAGVDGGDA